MSDGSSLAIHTGIDSNGLGETKRRVERDKNNSRTNQNHGAGKRHRRAMYNSTIVPGCGFSRKKLLLQNRTDAVWLE